MPTEKSFIRSTPGAVKLGRGLGGLVPLPGFDEHRHADRPAAEMAGSDRRILAGLRTGVGLTPDREAPPDGPSHLGPGANVFGLFTSVN